MGQGEYINHKITAVKSLHHFYFGAVGCEQFDEFFEKLMFHDRKRKNIKRGQNDANSFALKGSNVKCGERIEILHVDYRIPEYRYVFGYYKLDNNQKYSIYHHLHEGCIYTRSP